MLFAALAASAAATLVAAQEAKVVTVNVGATPQAPGGVFQFIPSTITAENNTIVNFKFSGIPGNHSVTQSSFADPCNPLPQGFDSGNVFETVAQPQTPEWNLTITNDQTPIWFFCKAPAPAPHCKSGMVGVINVKAGSANTFQAFQDKAKGTSGSGQVAGGIVGVGASGGALPVVGPSGTLIPGLSATATAPGGSGGPSGPSGSGPAQNTQSGTALTPAVNMFGVTVHALIVLGATVFGAALVL
ncbi:hypothetical protein C8J57DRAFT_1347262 [Mycena rebaudengoi]|nr:hypothetical protein C8J57DRAFT_1347262 [Mycena rebaudengoi]